MKPMQFNPIILIKANKKQELVLNVFIKFLLRMRFKSQVDMLTLIRLSLR